MRRLQHDEASLEKYSFTPYRTANLDLDFKDLQVDLEATDNIVDATDSLCRTALLLGCDSRQDNADSVRLLRSYYTDLNPKDLWRHAPTKCAWSLGVKLTSRIWSKKQYQSRGVSSL